MSPSIRVTTKLFCHRSFLSLIYFCLQLCIPLTIHVSPKTFLSSYFYVSILSYHQSIKRVTCPCFHITDLKLPDMINLRCFPQSSWLFMCTLFFWNMRMEKRLNKGPVLLFLIVFSFTIIYIQCKINLLLIYNLTIYLQVIKRKVFM